MPLDPRIKAYFAKKGVLPAGYDEAEQDVANAQGIQDKIGYAEVAGQMADNFANANRQDVILANRFEDLGRKPETVAAEKQKSDFSLANRLGVNKTDAARERLEQIKADMKARLGHQQADDKLAADQESAAAKQAFEREKFDAEQDNKAKEFDLRDRELKAKRLESGKAKEVDPTVSALREQTLIKAKRENAQALNPASKPLTVEQQARADNVRMAKEAVTNMAGALSRGDNTFSLVGDNDYTANLRLFQEAFGRMQSGGAIGKQEEARFRAMMPTITDSSEMQAKKIQMLLQELDKREKMLQSNGSTNVQAPQPASGTDYDSMSDEELMQLLNSGR